MHKIKLLALFTGLSFLTLHLGCNKVDPEEETTSSTDNAISELIFDDVSKIAQEAVAEEAGKFKKGFRTFGSCAEVIVTPGFPDTTFPKTFVVDFGTEYCAGLDLRRRKGKINIVITDWFQNKGANWEMTFDNYYIEDYKITGKRNITNTGKNIDGQPTYAVKTTDGVITTPDSKTIRWASENFRTWTEGYKTLNPADDVIQITGTANGTTRTGVTYTAKTTSPLQKEFSCRWISSGVLEISPAGLNKRTIDYGTGLCDNKASVTIGSQVFEIELP